MATDPATSRCGTIANGFTISSVVGVGPLLTRIATGGRLDPLRHEYRL